MTTFLLITGTPGTGKSTLSAKIVADLRAKGLSADSFLVNDFIKQEKLYDHHDPRLDTYIIDDRKVRKHLAKRFESLNNQVDFCVLETHTVTTIPKTTPTLVVVLTSRTEVLYDRLQARGYSPDKISENMECEIMRVVLDEATERFGEDVVLVRNSNDSADLNANAEVILERLFE